MTQTKSLASDRFAAREERFLEHAAQATGLDDFGDAWFRTGYRRFLASLDDANRLSGQGILATEHQIDLLLRCRLKTVAAWKDRPGYARQRIERPLIITGIVRSGTTALHRLLSIDPQFQGVQHWLVRAPRPRPPESAWPNDPDYRAAKAALDGMIALAPEMLNDHMMTADAVEESIFTLAPTFANNMFPSQWTIPDYDRWYRAIDEQSCYRWLADTLRLIGLDTPDRRWLLKNPTDLHAMEAVLDVFPDAMIVHTHRDPVQAIPSVANLLLSVRRMFEGENADPRAVIARETDFWAEALERTEAIKRREPKRFFDVDFRAFVADQMATVRGIYAHFGLSLAHEVEEQMIAWLAANPRRAGALQRHSAEDFGCRSAEIAERYRYYRANHGYA